MIVHLAGIGRSPSATEALTELAARDRLKVHTVTSDPAAADVIVFADLHLLAHDVGLRTLREHETYRRFPAKCFVYDERDHPWENMPGLYVSMPRAAFDPARMVAAPYYVLHRPEVPAVEEPGLLFSFMGSRSHALRREVLELRHERAVVEDTTGFVFYDEAASRTQRRRFAQVLADSKFVLCPRGAGTSSIRLFETLAVGRVPVVISDDWVPPPGPDWSRVSVRVREADVARIPWLLQDREAEWDELASGNRALFDELFAGDVAWHNLMSGVAALLATGATGGFAPSSLTRQRLLAELVHASWCSRARVRRVVRRR